MYAGKVSWDGVCSSDGGSLDGGFFDGASFNGSSSDGRLWILRIGHRSVIASLNMLELRIVIDVTKLISIET